MDGMILSMLAEAIQKRLCSEIVVTAETQRYMNSVLGISTLQDIQQTFQDDASSDSATFMELLLFPDEAFQLTIEPLIEACHFNEFSEQTIEQLLISRKLHTIIHFPDQGSISVRIPDEMIHSTVSRLNLSYSTDRSVIESLDPFLQEPLRTQVKVRLRNSGWIQHQPHIQLLWKLFQNLVPQQGDLLEYLDVVLKFLAVPHLESDIRSDLKSEKNRLVHWINLADRQDHLLRTAPMEAIMLQGIRRISIDKDEVIKQILILDHVCAIL